MAAPSRLSPYHTPPPAPASVGAILKLTTPYAMNRYIAIAGGFGLLLITAGMMGQSQKTTAVQPASAPLPEKTGLSESDAKAYQKEVAFLQLMMESRQQAGQKYREIGALDSALDQLKEATVYNSTAMCLVSQRKDAVPFYEAKARCKTAEG